MLTASDYQQLARDVVDPDVWDFIEGGAESERTLDANVAAFDRVRLRPRVLTDVSTVDTTVSVFGADFATPLGVAPTAYHRLVDPEGEVATARGAGAAGALFVVSVFASRTLEDIAKAAAGRAVAAAVLAAPPRRAGRPDPAGRATPATRRWC